MFSPLQILLCTAVAISSVAADCTKFIRTNETVQWVYSGNQSVQATIGLHCPEHTQNFAKCDWPLTGQVSVWRYTNISSSSAQDLSYLYPLAYESIGRLYRHRWVSETDVLNACIGGQGTRHVYDLVNILPGYSAYAHFVPILNCVSGSVADCSGDGLANGTGVKVCFPRVYPPDYAFIKGRHGQLPDGTYYNTHITQKQAEKVTVNPALEHASEACKRSIEEAAKAAKGAAPGSQRMPGTSGFIATGLALTAVLVQAL